MVGDRERAFAAGFDGYLPKPIVPETFLGTLRSFLPQAITFMGYTRVNYRMPQMCKKAVGLVCSRRFPQMKIL